MKTVLFAYRNVGYECVKYLLTIKRPPSLVVIPEENDYEKKNFKSVKDLCLENEVTFYEGGKIASDYQLLSKLEKIKPEIIFSCYYPYIIPKQMLEIPHKGGLNFHGGLLPEYRGTFSGVWSIINDESKSGVTLHYMDSRIDLGDIVEIKECRITDDDTGISLYKKTSIISIEMFKKYYNLISDKKVLKRKKQQLDNGRYYKRELPYKGIINWEWSSRRIFNFCRALFFPPFKSAKTYLFGKCVEIIRTRETLNKSDKKPGTFFEKKNRLLVSTSTFDLEILEIKIDGSFFEKAQLMKIML